jgi:phosphoenolpyruvate carboxylase
VIPAIRQKSASHAQTNPVAASRVDAVLQSLLWEAAEQVLPLGALSGLERLRRAARWGNDALSPVVESLPPSELSALLRLLALSGRIRRLTMDLPNEEPFSEDSIARCFAAYSTPEALAADLGKLFWRPVFTFHPSEIIPCAVADALAALLVEARRVLILEQQDAMAAIRNRLGDLLRQDVVASVRPTVEDEVEWLLHVFDRTVLEGVPAHFARLEQAAHARFGADAPAIPTWLRFHSWVAGDRDGNPHVTPASTRRAAETMRGHILQHYRLRLSGINAHAASDGNFRAMLAHLENRLYATAGRYPAAYRHTDSLRGDVRQAIIAAEQAGDHRAADSLWRLLRECDVFGLHLASLEWRQDSLSVWDFLECAREYGSVSAHGRLLTPALEPCLSERARDLVESLRTVAAARREQGAESVVALILANTTTAEEIRVLTRLARECGVFEEGVIPVVPLFETLEALRNAPAVMRALLADSAYHDDLAALGGYAEIMLGYSDSAKDGGRLAADIAVYEAAEALSHLFAAQAPEVKLVFFHGRGGSLGRGVATPEQAAVLCLPNISPATLKQTEQGEVLSRHYGSIDRTAAHLDRTAVALLETARQKVAPTGEEKEDFAPLLRLLATRAAGAYRALVQDPCFILFLEQVTPLVEIAALPITSRPARREGTRLLGLENLRAVSYNFALNQAGCPLPAWYGTGFALQAVLEDGEAVAAQLRRACVALPVLRIALDRAAAALGQTSMAHFMALTRNFGTDFPGGAALTGRIQAEYDRAVAALTAIGCPIPRIEPPELSIAFALQAYLLRRHRETPGRDPTDLRAAIAAVAAWRGETG